MSTITQTFPLPLPPFPYPQEIYYPHSLQLTDMALIRHYNNALQQKIALQKLQIQLQVKNIPKGRGGNNVSQNIKKSMLSILRKILPFGVYSSFQQQCIIKHKLRSQKQNIIIFYLYLHKYSQQSIIDHTHITAITTLLHKKIIRYIQNSTLKINAQEERKEFHLKNIEEFRKIMKIDLDFTKKRSFKELIQYLQPFYIRKVSQFHKAAKRLQNVIVNDQFFESLFEDLQFKGKSVKMEEGEPQQQKIETYSKP